jgi:hypothetical protein
VVVSYYDRRPAGNLLALLESMHRYPAGADWQACVVVNRTTDCPLALPEGNRIDIEYRPNLGMNIGAWDHGWRRYPGFQHYLFLQDECYVVRAGWLDAYLQAAAPPGVGMVGESLNRMWDHPWAVVRERLGNDRLPEHGSSPDGSNRVDFYCRQLREWGVEPGLTGRHLRSVAWFLSGPVLERMNGFFIGRNYGECIASEIAASRKLESLGLKVVQAAEEEFFYIRHLEYNQDYPGAPFSHDVKYVSYSSVKRMLEGRGRPHWWGLRSIARAFHR